MLESEVDALKIEIGAHTQALGSKNKFYAIRIWCFPAAAAAAAAVSVNVVSRREP